jgi:hypothetical protein
MCALLLCGGTYMYMLLWRVGATYPGGHWLPTTGSDPPSRTRHPVASGLQPTHQPGCATDVVAIAMPTPSVSNAVVNLIIGGVLSLRDNESCKAHLAEH